MTVTHHLTLYSFFSRTPSIKLNNLDPYSQQQKDSHGSVTVDFSHVRIVYKFEGRVTPNLDFKLTLLLQQQISKMVRDKTTCTTADR